VKRSEWANEWWQKALSDREAAKHLRNGGFWNECAFHCQQAAEKAIKALWVDVKKLEPPRVHWIEQLAESLGAPADIVDKAAVLVADYTATRYPLAATFGPQGEFTSDEADDRLARVEAVFVWVSEHWSE
jgi:HEPN domain-containing protein